jgi:hypothetical protein
VESSVVMVMVVVVIVGDGDVGGEVKSELNW